jgi:hypothetical protein
VSNFQSQQPYFDTANTEISNNYVQILFRPGQALQARELTALQSLLQYQINNIGDFLFKDGSPVTGGHITYDNTVLSLKLQANDTVSLSDFDGELIVNPSGAVTIQAVVVTTDDSTASNTILGSLVVKYLSGNEFKDGDTVQIAIGTQETATLVTSNSSTQGSIVSINEGVFYSDGYFIFVPRQTIVLDSQSTTPSFRIGLEIDTSIVSSVQDSTLLDPAQGSFNFQAPGADRYQYSLVLAKRTLNSTDDSRFFELMRIENGVITSLVEYPVLGGIDNVLAQRTYDASGNFTVNPFVVTASDDPSNSNNIILNISPGKAYVEGYEFETIATVKVNDAKARTTNTSTNYDLSLEFGNYVTVSNVNSGNVIGFSTQNFGQLDLHIVPSGNVVTSNAQMYGNTKIGTARIRDIEYDGTNNWLAYLLDVSFTPIVVNANAVSSNTTSVSLPPSFTSSTNAIANVQLTVLTGNSSGDVRTLVSYNPSTKIGFLDRPTTQLLDTTSQLSLSFGIKDVDGLAGTPSSFSGNVYATQNATSGLYPCMDVSVNGKDTLGNTILFNTNFNRLDFALPQSFVSQNSFSNVTFMNRKTIPNVTFTSGNTTIGTGTGLDSNEVYTFGFNAQFLPDTITRNNFFLVVRDKQTSNLANGQVIVWDHGSIAAGNGVFQTDSTHVTIKTVTTGSFLADVLLTVQDQNASVNFRRSKTKIGNTSNTTLLSTDRFINGSAVIGTANANSVYIDSANGFVWFTNNNDIIKIPGITQKLYVPDVVQIVKIYDSGSPTAAPNTNNAIDITNRFLFDSGQRDNYYDHGSIILQPGNNPPAGQTVVMLQFYQHDATTGFFSADSYSAVDYASGAIPVYFSQRFGAVNLRDVIDFRPTRTIGSTANVANFTLSGLRLPQPDNSMVLTYNYYLGRIDKLVLTNTRQFQVIKGNPALTPNTPADQAGSMTLYSLGVPPYTYYASNVSLNYLENKRYTMADIGALDSRIQQLEYFASLTQSQQSAMAQTVLYQDGTTPKEQFGIVTDDFVDFTVADTNNPDLFCRINGGQLTPYIVATPLAFNFQSATGPFSVNDRTYTLEYSELPCIVQNTASDFTQIQPYAFGEFKGDVALYPQTDFWYSDNLVPQIIGPPAPQPPPPPPAPVVAPSIIGATTDKNSANLTPATTTTQPVIPSPPPAGPAQPATTTVFQYCLPLNNYLYNYNALSYGNLLGYGLPSGIGNVFFYGHPCFAIQKSPTGFGILEPNGGWYPLTAQQVINYERLYNINSSAHAVNRFF